MKVEMGTAEKILQELRTHIYNILGSKLEKYTIVIYADSHMEGLKCEIGNGRNEVVINILGDKMKWMLPGVSTDVQQKAMHRH